ncbi:LacI family DNA-binding transcriptional regulator [uncultured Roseobacter sp.]|uniref:LacI family DNA-binding transcriptional regulator n=1 Tax=uncultured Roseobacter sp. TaxID=114847 RepID=UPI00260F7368|nr:LacI family DNA-binding transcriptional regulator [uncultured Roseobacter sp.]
MPTVKDVARHAGVSVGTVSKVLSEDQTVKVALRERVLQAVTDLNYRPNMAARALRTNKFNIIGLVVPDITNPFFAQLALNIETEAARRGHTVMLTNSHDDTVTEGRQIAALLDRSPRGLIVAACNDTSAKLESSEVRVLSLDRRFHSFPLVSTDHADGSAKVATYLISLGHQRLAYLAGPQDTEVGRQRLAGFVRQFEVHNAQNAALQLEIHNGQFDFHSGEILARKLLLQSEGERPTAIAAASDQMAIGVLRAARDMGISVPQSVSVAGFDDTTLASLVVPRLTTVAQPTEKLAKKAVERVLDESSSPLEDVLLEGSLVIRESTARILPAGHSS